MNFIDRLKKIFRNKEEIKQEQTTTLSLYDVSDVILPSIEELNDLEKELYLKYKNEIQLDNLESILKYNENVSKEGKYLSNLLIKVLDELNEVIRKNDKTEEELQKIDINTSIKNMKILVIKNLLQGLKHECDIRTLAIQNKRQEYEKKEHKFVEIFSRAARIKRNMELRSLTEAENRSKITIKTIMMQLGAVNNSIYANNITINKMDIYNNLISNIQKDNIRKKIYIEKLEYLVDIAKNLNCKFTRLSEISNLLKHSLDFDTEQQILENFALSEVELDKFIIENKDKMVEEYLSKTKEFMELPINNENKNELLNKAEKLQIILETFKEYIEEQYREDIYKIKFVILSFDVNKQISLFSKFREYLPLNDYRNEIEHYIKIISDKINDINQGISPVAKNLKEASQLKKMIKLLNPYFKTQDGKYRYKDILFNRELLALLQAFHNEQYFDEFFKEYKYYIKGREIKKSVNLPWHNVEWADYIPLKTIYTLYEVDGIEKPPFYDIYKLYHEKIQKEGRDSYYSDDVYYMPEGIVSIHSNDELKKSYYGTYEDKLLSYIRDESYNKNIVLPSTLKRIRGDIFSEFKSLSIFNGVEYIGGNTFIRHQINKLFFPKSVCYIDPTSFDFSSVKEIEFKDFKESKLLYNLLYDQSSQYSDIIKQLYGFDYSYQIYSEKNMNYHKKADLVPKLSKIILSDEDKKIEITYPEIYYAINRSSESKLDYTDKVRYCLAILIEQKTGVNIKEYHEEHYKQK